MGTNVSKSLGTHLPSGKSLVKCDLSPKIWVYYQIPFQINWIKVSCQSTGDTSGCASQHTYLPDNTVTRNKFWG